MENITIIVKNPFLMMDKPQKPSVLFNYC